jgi:sialate O-acetylesterase
MDVLVGEVWLGSGQSNMAMAVSRALDFQTEQAAANLPQIRMFTERSSAATAPQPDASGTWSVCSPETVGTFSATLYFFGRELHSKLQVPVGLINSSVGGTPIESWIAAEAQAKTPELRAAHEAAIQALADFDATQAQAQFEKALARWREQAAAAKAAGKTAPRRPTNPADQRNRRGGPGGLFNGKIAPLIPYAIRGAVWYQGEANSQPGKGHLYQYQLPLLVRDWRERWGEEFPFAWVQLPNFGRNGEGWMLVREAMLKTLRLPNTGMAITVDIGESNDIHPKNKQDVGRRLAFWALGTVYQQTGIATSGPLPDGHTVNGAGVVCSFTHTDGGLRRASGGELKGFSLAGEDRQWQPATAVIVGDKVLVSHPNVRKPVAVRYAWASDPECNLTNGQGLPASPFRTDDWPVADTP